ncbi:PREDICTED: cold shock domain-containing protein C2 [Rhinopithecus bieti]|uniref:Cold shock domain containing C2 n=1 Tax=Rhinopithecus bieti TaxID=61621 RepID=A0A2K6M5Q5_RHIBE|nr:PREDICTED: cold shock domain-containing protein C2 [Rhinopithecus bieti]
MRPWSRVVTWVGGLAVQTQLSCVSLGSGEEFLRPQLQSHYPISRTARASAGPVFKGVCKQFSRSQGHGFITPENGSEDIFVHVSDIEGEYVPVEGDEVTYKMCPIPPKNQKFQAVEVVLTQLAPHTPHETWSGQVVGS